MSVRSGTRRTLRIAALVGGLGGLAPAMAMAESVAYVDNGEIWVSTIDAGRTTRLSGGEGIWMDVAHASGGTVVGVKNEPGAIGQRASFTKWGPHGAAEGQGILPNDHVGWVLATPLNMDLTPDGGLMVWGYSGSTYSVNQYIFDRGTYFTATSNSAGVTPLKMSGEEWPALAGTRLVSVSGRTVTAMKDVASAPYSNQSSDFVPWIDTSSVLDSTWDITGIATSADGGRVALTFTQYTGGTLTGGKIAVLSTGGLGQPPDGVTDCWLPASGIAQSPASISADGTLLAWQDSHGVAVASMPTGNGELCTMPSAPVVISPTGKMPDLGGFSVPTAPVPGTSNPTPSPTPSPAPASNPTPTPTAPGSNPTPSPGVGARPIVAAPSRTTVRSLTATGIAVRITSPVDGTVRVSLTVPGRRVGTASNAPVVIARVAIPVKKGVAATAMLKLLPSVRSRVRRIKGARLTLSVVTPDNRTTRSMITAN